IDLAFSEINLTMPEKKLDIKKSFGDGVAIYEYNFFSNRQLELKKRFTNKNDNFQTFFDFISDFFFTKENIYLCRKRNETETDVLQFFLQDLSDLKLNNYAITKDITIKLISQEPFFSIYPIIESDLIIINTNPFELTILNNNEKTYFFFYFENVSNITIEDIYRNYIELKNYTTNFTINTKTLNSEYYLNSEKYIKRNDGMPLLLEKGNNTFYLKTNSINGAVKYFYNKKIL
ncbi:MAG: hypothetical protein WBJ84_11780, partial [Bacteroidales bacterium]